MSTPQSFVSPALEARLDALRLRAFATRLVTGVSEDVTLWRDTDAGGESIGPTTVLIELANRQDYQNRTNAADLNLMDGQLTAYAPWDVQKGDRFTLSSGLSGQIRVVPPAAHGLQTATFALAE
jgi:hypothetical protein